MAKNITFLLILVSFIAFLNILFVGSRKEVYTTLKASHSKRACAEYLEGFRLLEENCDFSPDKIPKMGVISSFLQKTSGFRLRPVAGLVSPRDFLANFAFRIFPCTQYVRHHSRPAHTPEPDVIHEFLGHVPLLTNRKFADFAQRLGLVSLGASNDFVNKLTTLFWFTIEFGLCLELDQLRAVGAGILSSFGELEHAFSDESEKRPLEPSTTAIQPYDDVGYQPVYFVCQSFELMEQQLNEYVRTVQKDVWATYDPYTETVNMQSSTELRGAVIESIAKQIVKLKFTNPV
ncbi:hypothetical protein P879_00536 [Paragonimus westermani]|uniref:Biopterin-dependent aromatic amino acid hydroxylase family profile domain-containing protein n=1 Tax=Paragonimus westermani TaxID=34504 RepID=A0A8T0DTW9_9TREM|nr:hypothetical protein P879_00536 [Paragonimus westermani]